MTERRQTHTDNVEYLNAIVADKPKNNFLLCFIWASE